MFDTAQAPRTGGNDIARMGSLACWRRPRSRWETAVFHLPLAMITGTALLLPYCVALEALPLIPCTFLRLTGYPCPFCGFTRSFWAIAHGHWAEALANCPLSAGVFFVVAATFAWHATALAFGVVLSRGPILQLAAGYRRKAAAAVMLLFALNWMYRLAMGLT